MDTIDIQLNESKNIAVVGLSNKPERASYGVAKYLQDHGYNIIPVNPAIETVLGQKSYPDLDSVPIPIDLVDIFRQSEAVPPIVDEAIKIGAKFIWMQDGVFSEPAKLKAEQAGLLVTMDNCILREHSHRFGDTHSTNPLAT